MSEEMNLKKVLGFGDVLSIAVGQTIGSGVMALTGIAIGMTGTGVVLAFIISSLLCVIMTLPTAVMGSAMPTTGGSYRYCSKLLSPKVGFFYILLYMAYNLTLALFAISFAEYAQSIIPSVPFKIVALGLLTLFYIINLLGVKNAAILQKTMVVILFAALVIFIIFGFPQVNFEVFNSEEMFPKGFLGFFTTVGLLTFATGGANVVANMGGEMKNPGRDIPLAIVIGTISVGVLYAFMSTVASGVLPVEQVANKPLSDVAKAILPTPLFVFFIVGGAMFAIATTLNSTFSWVTKPLIACCNDGWLPKSLGAVNKRFGTPHWLLTLFYAIGIIPVITGTSLAAISMLGSGLALFMGILPVIASTQLHKKYPEEFKKAYFKFSPKKMYIIAIVSALLLIFQSTLLFAQLSKGGFIALIIYIFIAIIVANIVGNKKKASEANMKL